MLGSGPRIALDAARGSMSGIPKSKFSEINASFNAFALGYSTDLAFNEIQFARVRNDLEKCARSANNVDAAKAYSNLAHLVSYRYDRARFYEYIAVAERLAGKNEDWYYGYVSGAVNLGLFQEARRELDAVAFDNDVWWLNYKYCIYTSMCLFDSALACAASLALMSSEGNNLNRTPALLHVLAKASDLLKQSELSENQTFELVCLAAEVVGGKLKKPLSKYSLSADYESGILYSFSMNEPADTMVELEWEIMERLVDESDVDTSGVFTINVSYPSK